MMGFASVDSETPLIPIEIVEAEGGDFMRPDAEPGQQQEDGMIAQGRRGFPVQVDEDPLHLRGRQARGSGACVHCRGGGTAASRPGDSSPQNTRNRRNERTATLGILRPPPVGGGFLTDKRRHVLGRQGAPPLARGATGAQEACDDAAIPRTRTGGSPADVLQVLGILLEPVGRSGVRGRLGSRWQEPLLLPEGQQMGETRSGFRTATHRRPWQGTEITRDEGGIHVGNGIALLG